MGESRAPLDQRERELALDPGRSFIVQAPAGSGKTELLTQRFLRLLATVEDPEEIWAITFTRKAVAEMRNRILGALEAAAGPEPAEEHRRKTWTLAREANRQAREHNWQLAANPNRLRIQTFDSLAASLVRQMPLGTGLGDQPATRDDCTPLYRLAARNCLAGLDDPDMRPHLSALLVHLDNDVGRAEALLVDMLQRRDQWLPHVLGRPDPGFLEQALREQVETHLAAVRNAVPASAGPAISRLARFAVRNLVAQGKASPAYADWENRIGLPGTAWEDISAWLAIVDLFFTKGGKPRETWDKRAGFPAAGEKGIDAETKQLRADSKTEVEGLRDELREASDLLERLAGLRKLPPQGFSASQRALMGHLVEVMLNAAAQLRLVFAEAGEVDYGEIQSCAVQALGQADEPSELALILDYSLSHLLVDEFQDTSTGQYQLIERLTSEWQPGDGRSLFVVGDPMQSIYRFRKAEVGLFLRARTHGIGRLALDPLTLRTNFRSTASIVDWVNRTFAPLFPDQEDVVTGAVAYATSSPNSTRLDDDAVQVHASPLDDRAGEAAEVARVVTNTLRTDPRANVAVLVRSKAHLADIATALHAAGQPFQALDIVPLANRPQVSDLYMLTRALAHAGDRLAWLSVLRAPWLGLGLDALLRITDDSSLLIHTRLRDENLLAQLDAGSRTRVQRFIAAVEPWLPLRGRRPLREIVEAIWLGLGGHALWGEATAGEAMAYLDLLGEMEEAGSLAQPAQLAERLGSLFAPPDSHADDRVQLMSMHKAKGLEFHTVILPGLGRKPRNPQPELLYWQELPTGQDDGGLLMAPIRAANEKSEAISAYLQHLENEKGELETLRLLYVAATRARVRLHLFGHVNLRPGKPPAPTASSLLHHLWPAVAEHYEELVAAERPGPTDDAGIAQASIRCLRADWQHGLPPTPVIPPPGSEPAGGLAIDFEWAGDTARHVGTLVHRYLERIANDGVDKWPVARIDGLQAAFRAGLARLGVVPGEMETASDKVRRALILTLSHDNGLWILGDHPEAACELALTVDDDGLSNYVIDRTFVADGIRWIVDYKTGDHLDDDKDAFLDAEVERYRAQLENYGRLFSLLESRPIRLALYFPLLRDWRTWDYASGA